MRGVYENQHATAYLECHMDKDWHVCEIYCDPEQRRRGHATELLRQITLDADREGVQLTLEVCPLDLIRPGLSQVQLSDWYSRHGFRRHGHHDCLFYYMKREAQNVQRIAA